MTLNIDQLFTPAGSGVGTNPNLAPQPGTWFAIFLDNAATLGLPTTSWQPGAPERTIMSVASVALQQEDVAISVMAQGGFLDFAASGTVVTSDVNGNQTVIPVTPDPSIPSQNPTGAPGWLDALGQSFFKVTRLQATYAPGTLAIANTTAGTVSYVAGNYHVANGSTGATYTNTAALSIPSSSIPGTGGTITGITVGTSTTTITTQTAHGLAVNQTVYVSGTTGVTDINGVFALVTAVTATTFTIQHATSGAWTGGGKVFLCTVAPFQADSLGIVSNAAPGAVTVTVTQNPGIFVDNLAAWSASNYESNTKYADRCRLKLAALSPNGPAAANEYFALTAQQILAAQSPPVTLTNGPIAKAISFSNPVTGVVETIVTSSSPQSTTLGAATTPGCAALAITATNGFMASPIQVTTAGPHGLLTGYTAIVSGVLGNTAANGAWTVTFVNPTNFTLNSSTGSGTYTGGGQVDGGDLGEVDNLIQVNTTPDRITNVTESSLAFPVLVVATVVVPQAFFTTYQAAAPIALQNLLATFPIGGIVEPGDTGGTVSFSAIEGALVSAGVLTVGHTSYVRQVSGLTVNGLTANVPYPSPDYDAILVTPTIAVVGV